MCYHWQQNILQNILCKNGCQKTCHQISNKNEYSSTRYNNLNIKPFQTTKDYKAEQK